MICIDDSDSDSGHGAPKNVTHGVTHFECINSDTNRNPDPVPETGGNSDYPVINSGSSSSACSNNMVARSKLALHSNIPESFICVLSLQTMVNPVVAADGYSYERTAIENWLLQSADKLCVSPTTGATLAHHFLIPNIDLRAAIADYYAKTKSTANALPFSAASRSLELNSTISSQNKILGTSTERKNYPLELFAVTDVSIKSECSINQAAPLVVDDNSKENESRQQQETESLIPPNQKRAYQGVRTKKTSKKFRK